MALRGPFLFVLMVAGCASHGDDTTVAGTWKLGLRTIAPGTRYPTPPPLHLTGVIELQTPDEAPNASTDGFAPAGARLGSGTMRPSLHDVFALPVGMSAPPSVERRPEDLLYWSLGDSIHFVVRPQVGHGGLIMDGTLSEGRIRGRWYHVVTGGASGDFTLERLTQERP